MKTMRLHLFQTIHYICISDTSTLFTPESGLYRLKHAAEGHGVSLNDDEIAIFTRRENIFHTIGNSLAIGAGPTEQSLDIGSFHTREISEGSYFFYQFPDSSEDGIRSALQYGINTLDARGLIPASDEVILRGIKETDFYVFQILILLK